MTSARALGCKVDITSAIQQSWCSVMFDPVVLNVRSPFPAFFFICLSRSKVTRNGKENENWGTRYEARSGGRTSPETLVI